MTVKLDIDDVTAVVKVTKMEQNQIFTILKYQNDGSKPM